MRVRVQDKLKGDVLKRMASPLLALEDCVALFEAHCAALLAQARQQYLAALDGAIKPAMFSEGELQPRERWGDVARDFEAASEVLAAHACFQRLPAAERRATWQRYVHDTANGAPNPGAPRIPMPGGAPPGALPPRTGPAGPPPQQALSSRRFDNERDGRPRERGLDAREDRERGERHRDSRGRDAGRHRDAVREGAPRRYDGEQRGRDRDDERRGRRVEDRDRDLKRPRR